MVIVQVNKYITNPLFTLQLTKLTIRGQYLVLQLPRTQYLSVYEHIGLWSRQLPLLGRYHGAVVSASSDGSEIVFQIWKWGYYNGCDNDQGSEIQAQVSVEVFHHHRSGRWSDIFNLLRLKYQTIVFPY